MKRFFYIHQDGKQTDPHRRHQSAPLALLLAGIVFCPFGPQVFQAELFAEKNLFDMSLEELMNVSLVVSSSRTEQKLTESPVPVTVITAEEIHASGLTNIPEILQFYTGMDVAKLDRTRWIVGVHGMHSEFSDRTLVLLDGRSIMNPVFGAPNWLNLPIFLEDIEQIEITRGPAGAVWGANAFNGVINIITKKPDRTRNLLSTTVSQHGDSFTHLRWANTQDKWAWKISAGFETIQDSDAAGAGKYQLGYPDMAPLIPVQTYPARDFLRIWKTDSVISYQTDPSTKWTFGAAASANETGDREMCGRFPQEDVHIEMLRLFSRTDFGIDEDISGHLQWYGNYAAFETPFVIDRYDYFENDFEGQLTLTPNEKHTITMGGSARWTRIRNRNQTVFGEILFSQKRYEEYWTGFFLMDQVKLTDRLTLEAQGRIDRYSESGTDASVRLSSLYALDEARSHILRAGFARAFRAPTIMLRETTLNGLMGLVNIIPIPEKLKNESVSSIEAGYSGQLTEHLFLRTDVYYQRMEDLIGSEIVSEIGPVQNSTFFNIDGADAWGTDCEITFRHSVFTAAAFYSFNHLRTDFSEQNIRAFFPSEHKTGLRVRWKLDEKWAMNLNYVYNNLIPITPTGSPPDDIEVKNRLDITFTRQIAQGKGEWMLGVTDLFNQTVPPVHDISYFTAYETPGRTFFTRLQLSF